MSSPTREALLTASDELAVAFEDELAGTKRNYIAMAIAALGARDAGSLMCKACSR